MIELPPVECHMSSTLVPASSRSPPANHCPLEGEGDASKDYYISRLQLLLHQIDYRYITLPPSPTTFMSYHNDWIHNTLGPMTSWTTNNLNQLKDSSLTIIERGFPFADTEMRILLAKLTALAILIDDSLDDDAICNDLTGFAHRLYNGDSQPSGILDLYQEHIKELSHAHEGDAVLRGLAVTPWISFVDGCLLEKRLMTVNPKLRASPYDMGYNQLAKQSHLEAHGISQRATLQFPIYLRHKTDIGEAYAAAIFKTDKKQNLPLSRYIMALPDIIFHVNVMNDVLSFHKEELAGEKANLIHLQTKSLKDHYKGASKEWTVSDTFDLLCNELRDAILRVDEVLRLHVCERMTKDELESIGLSDVDVAIALQWRGWRDGYISWHLDSQRYKLGFIQPAQFQTK